MSRKFNQAEKGTPEYFQGIISDLHKKNKYYLNCNINVCNKLSEYEKKIKELENDILFYKNRVKTAENERDKASTRAYEAEQELNFMINNKYIKEESNDVDETIIFNI